MPNDSAFLNCLLIVKLLRIESRSQVIRSPEDGEIGSCYVTFIEFLVLGDENDLEEESVNVYMTL